MIKKKSSKIVYKNPWMKLREDEVEFPNGHEGIYSYVDKTDFSLVIPFKDGGFYLVKQFRYPIGKSFWEFPQGRYEPEALNPYKTALRELKEETGLVPGDCKEVGYLHEASGYCNQGFHIYVTENHIQKEQELEITESDIVCKWFSENEFLDLIRNGEIVDATSISAYQCFKLNY